MADTLEQIAGRYDDLDFIRMSDEEIGPGELGFFGVKARVWSAREALIFLEEGKGSWIIGAPWITCTTAVLHWEGEKKLLSFSDRNLGLYGNINLTPSQSYRIDRGMLVDKALSVPDTRTIEWHKSWHPDLWMNAGFYLLAKGILGEQSLPFDIAQRMSITPYGMSRPAELARNQAEIRMVSISSGMHPSLKYTFSLCELGTRGYAGGLRKK